MHVWKSLRKKLQFVNKESMNGVQATIVITFQFFDNFETLPVIKIELEQQPHKDIHPTGWTTSLSLI